ncbi:ABC transporter permease [Paraoerskovia marina]|uniref:ABC transporter permease n=1 Tax=Paraoerskovia marina TaxID=545619 RepID=UPI000492512F|nr:ABC transporter permease [Paraoerskovia marina]
MRATIIKEFRELRRDKRTLAMLIGLPLMLLIIFGFAANFTIDTLTVSVVGSDASQAEQLVSQSPDASDQLDLTTVDEDGTEAQVRDQLADDEVDMAILTGDASPSDRPTVLIDGSNLFAAQTANVIVAGLGDAVDSEILYNPDLETSWVMVPALIGLILTFIGTIITSIGLVREREQGTLEQLAVMPFSSASVIIGKITPYFILACVDMVIITVLGMWVFDVPFNGSVTAFVLGAAIFLFVVLGIGVLISTVSQTTGQAVQVAMMTLLPQVLLSGMIFPLEAMAAGVRWIGYLLPLTYFTKISQGIMLRDSSWSYLWPSLAVLVLMAVVIFGTAVVRLRRDLAPAKAR